MRKHVILAAVMAVCGAAAAHAENGSNGANEPAESKAFLGSKIAIAQAIAKAEAQAGGKASSANFVADGDGAAAPFYHVEVVAADGSQKDLAVDAATGEVTKVLSMEGDDHGDNGNDGE